MLAFRRCHCFSASSWPATRAAVPLARVNRGSHSQAAAQQAHAHKLSVSRIDGVRIVSAAGFPSFESSGCASSSRDVVVCIGWMGCREKHLDKVYFRCFVVCCALTRALHIRSLGFGCRCRQQLQSSRTDHRRLTYFGPAKVCAQQSESSRRCRGAAEFSFTGFQPEATCTV